MGFEKRVLRGKFGRKMKGSRRTENVEQLGAESLALVKGNWGVIIKANEMGRLCSTHA